jgi:hypothetical protein
LRIKVVKSRDPTGFVGKLVLLDAHHAIYAPKFSKL